LRIKHNKTSLALLIENAYNNYGFVSAFIYGHQGAGKTTYALKTLYYVYGDWDKALEYTFFDIRELENKLKWAFIKNKRIKAILLDDAGYSLIKYSWRDEYSQKIAKLFNLARTVVSGILFTSIETTDIIAFIRDKIMYPVSIRIVDKTYSEARGYRIYLSPLMEKIPKKVFRDLFIRRLPDHVYKKYEEKRREALANLFGLDKKREELESLTREGLDKIIQSWK
jgi:hypothetical protein